MEVLQAAFLGVVQGMTEVLPISSSAHLVLMPWFFDFKDPGLSFDVALHLGTLTAILVYFRKEVVSISKGGLELMTKKDLNDTNQKLFIFLGLATIPGVFAGFFLSKQAEEGFRSPLLIAATLFIFAMVLFLADKYGEKNKNQTSLEKMSFKHVISVGLSQALAIVPGVSRSGVTMSAGLFSGIKKEDAARFSFLLSIPIIVGAAIYQLKDFTSGELLSSVFVAGFIAAALAAFLSVRFLMNYIKKNGFNIFVYYRVALAIFIVVLFYVRGA